jgi:hypothetical protein
MRVSPAQRKQDEVLMIAMDLQQNIMKTNSRSKNKSTMKD